MNSAATATGLPRTRRALTLLELLAILMILSISAGAVIIRLGPVQENVVLQSAAHALQDLDGRARLLAARGERVAMELDSERSRVRLIAIDSGEMLSREALPAGTSIRARAADTSDVVEVVFDRSGRSLDYRMMIQRGERTISWRVRGATGSIVQEEPDT